MKFDYHAATEMRGRGLSNGQIARRFKMTVNGVRLAFKRGYTGEKTETYIGPLCRRGHNDEGGGSRRYKNGGCVRCIIDAEAERVERNGAPRPCKAETYAGRLCTAGHDDGTGHTQRYRKGLACVDCMRAHNARSRIKRVAATQQ